MSQQLLDDIHVPKKMTANFFDDQLMLHLAPFTINDQQNYCHFHQRNFVKSASWLMLACYTKVVKHYLVNISVSDIAMLVLFHEHYN